MQFDFKLNVAFYVTLKLCIIEKPQLQIVNLNSGANGPTYNGILLL
jgi:hypothetical protein